MIWLFILTVFFYIAWWRLIINRLTTASVGDGMLGAFVLTVGQMVAIVFLLGLFGVIDITTVLTGNLIVTCAAFWFGGVKSWGDEESRGLLWQRIEEMFADPACMIVAALTTAAVGFLVWIALAGPMESYDGWGYHVPKAILMARTGWLQPWMWTGETFQRGFDTTTYPTDFYPANSEILGVYPVLWGLSVRWQSLLQLPFALAGVLAIYRVLRNAVDVSVEGSALVAMGMLSLWCIMGQVTMAMNDLMAASLIWIGYAMAMGTGTARATGILPAESEGRNPPMSLFPLLLSSLATGLAIGTKESTAYWAVGICGLVIYKSIKEANHG